MTLERLLALVDRNREPPVLVFVAGPNGAGKSTLVTKHLSRLGLPVVNADRIATSLAASEGSASGTELDRRALAVADELRETFLEAGVSFVTETVFSDPVGARLAFLRRARDHGFTTVLVFVGLESPMLSCARVSQRVRRGEHDIPDEKLHARFPRTLANLAEAIPLVDDAYLLDNSSFDRPFRVVAVYAAGELVSRNPPIPGWAKDLRGLSPGG